MKPDKHMELVERKLLRFKPRTPCDAINRFIALAVIAALRASQGKVG